MKLRSFITSLKKLSGTRLVGLFLLGLFSMTPILAASHEIQHAISHARTSSEAGYTTEESCSLCLVAIETRQVVSSPFFEIQNNFDSIPAQHEFPSRLFSLIRELPRARGPPA